jgi:hypothetical protein
MTEQEWLQATDPQPMLEFIRDKASDRKLRLFAVACCRQDSGLLESDFNWLAVETSECYADGRVSRKELKAIRRVVWEALGDSESKAAWEVAGGRAWEAAVATLWRLLPDIDIACLVARLHDIFGNPFHQVILSPAVLAWNDGVVVRLAQVAYEERHMPPSTLDNGRLAILADALEEAGCADAEILGHLRGPGPHVRGCWPVDLCLGKL